jgi:hypothetical protein
MRSKKYILSPARERKSNRSGRLTRWLLVGTKSFFHFWALQSFLDLGSFDWLKAFWSAIVTSCSAALLHILSVLFFSQKLNVVGTSSLSNFIFTRARKLNLWKKYISSEKLIFAPFVVRLWPMNNFTILSGCEERGLLKQWNSLRLRMLLWWNSTLTCKIEFESANARVPIPRKASCGRALNVNWTEAKFSREFNFASRISIINSRKQKEICLIKPFMSIEVEFLRGKQLKALSNQVSVTPTQPVAQMKSQTVSVNSDQQTFRLQADSISCRWSLSPKTPPT